MPSKQWAEFKNGSDIRGVAVAGVENEPLNLTNEKVSAFAKGFAVWLKNKTGKTELTVALGHDSRISADRLTDCVKEAFIESGINVILTGLSSTPAMFMTTKSKLTECDGAVMITASHLPYNRNGLKFFTGEGGLEGSDITAILDIAENGETITGKGSVKSVDFMSEYAKILRNFVIERTGKEKPFEGKKIIVDAGNGAGGFYVDKVLKPLGANVDGSQFLEPDGNFPNHIPNPENKDAMKSICDAVKKSRADFGIIFDTDVDRAGAVDASGKEINRNKLIALISAILLEETPNATIVTDSITSDGLTDFIKSKSGVHHRFKRGYKNVINEAIRLNNSNCYCPLAIETSGHAALKENYFLDDGAYLVTRLLVKLALLSKEGKSLSSLIADLKMPTEEAEVRMGFETGVDFKAYGAKVLEDLKIYAKDKLGWEMAKVNYEGLRISFGKDYGNGWLLLRMSLHDPIMPLNIESEEKGGTRIIAEELYEFLKNYDSLNIENLKNFIL